MANRLPGSLDELTRTGSVVGAEERLEGLVRAGGFPATLTEAAAAGGGRNVWGRTIHGLARYWWVVALSVLVGSGASWFLWSTQEPVYRARGSLWVGLPEGVDPAATPAAPSPAGGTWLEVLRSWSVLDTAAVEAGLHITPYEGTPPMLLEGLVTTDSLRAGTYVLTPLGDGTLRLFDEAGAIVDSAGWGETIGGSRGFAWAPRAELLREGRRAAFILESPRQAARRLSEDLSADLVDQGSIIRVEVRSDDPGRAARAVNAVMARTMRLAATLKRAQLDERGQILLDQLLTAEADLVEAENQLQRFGVSTATLPGEGTTRLGTNVVRSPIFNRYAELRDEADAYASDRARLEEALEATATSGVPIEAMEGIEAVRGSTELMAALTELADARADVRALELRPSATPTEVAGAEARATLLEKATIPNLGRRLLSELSDREAEARNAIDETSAELTAIPPRAIEEARLLRRAQIAEQVYTSVRERYEEQRIEAASSIPELRVLDAAVPPDEPDRGPATGLIATILTASLLFGVAMAAVADQLDPKLRREDDVIQELGLEVIGSLPALRTGRGQPDEASLAALQEAFRHLRLNVAYAHRGGGTICLAVVSPNREDGKTTVAANLATAFAETGRRTLLIDADTHTGDLHSVLDTTRTPGLTDLLAEDAELEEAVAPSPFDDLELLPSGTRMTTSPQLLGSRPMQRLLAEARAQYDVVIVDTPPLGSSSDGLVLGAMCGRLVLVMRVGATDREVAAVCVERLRKLPMQIMGVVLNGVRSNKARPVPVPDLDHGSGGP